MEDDLHWKTTSFFLECGSAQPSLFSFLLPQLERQKSSTQMEQLKQEKNLQPIIRECLDMKAAVKEEEVDAAVRRDIWLCFALAELRYPWSVVITE